MIFEEAFTQFRGRSYFEYGNEQVFMHGLRLAAGLASQLKGEAQILGQLEHWLGQECFPGTLRQLWQEAIAGARLIRQRALLEEININIANVILEDLMRLIPRKKALKIIILGTGKVAGLFSQQNSAESKLYFVSHKNRSRAEELACWSAGTVISFQDLTYLLPQADALISAASCPHFLLRKDDVARMHRKQVLYIYDLALPRNIAPEVAVVEKILLRNLDDLSLLCKDHNAKIASWLSLAERLAGEIIENRRIRESFRNHTHWNKAESIGIEAGARGLALTEEVVS
jgi:glutamyl-tRNA reductase